jgi:hypothetical protein
MMCVTNEGVNPFIYTSMEFSRIVSYSYNLEFSISFFTFYKYVQCSRIFKEDLEVF